MIVVDSSVSLKWFLADEPDADIAATLLYSDQLVIVPEIAIAEIANAAWKLARLGDISPDGAQDIARAVPHIFDRIVPGAALVERAAQIAFALDHPVYDCFYIALAEREAVEVITADRRLAARVIDTAWSGHVRLLSQLRRGG